LAGTVIGSRGDEVQFLNTAGHCFVVWPDFRPHLTWQKGTEEVTQNFIIPAMGGPDDIIK